MKVIAKVMSTLVAGAALALLPFAGHAAVHQHATASAASVSASAITPSDVPWG